MKSSCRTEKMQDRPSIMSTCTSSHAASPSKDCRGKNKSQGRKRIWQERQSNTEAASSREDNDTVFILNQLEMVGFSNLIFNLNMQANEKPVRKPALSSQQKVSADSYDKKVKKVEVFYRYHIASLYRQLKNPIYQKLLQLKKQGKPERLPEIKKTVEELIQSLYKYASLNSKYRHREKMRFQRTPLLKYIHFDFIKLKELLKSKKYMEVYDDLEDDDDQDEGPVKIQYEKDPSFNEQTIANYKRKHNINGKICIALGYEDLKHGLVSQYGWHENQGHTSLIFDLKFMSKKKNIDYVNLLDCQYINHFEENKSITAKFGLARNIRNLASVGRDPSVIFPRCYDLNDVAQLQDFYQDFKSSQLKSYLYEFIASKGKIYKDQVKMMRMILNLLPKELLPLEKKVDYVQKGKALYITQEEWRILQKWNDAQKGQPTIEQGLLKEAITLSEAFQAVDPQWSLNKDNIWIVKPASMSRGRGIKTFNDLQEILEYVIGCEISWVAQKYIERPLIVRKKKFDIRQWVLWTDFKPLRVWMFEECYFRFCAQIYTPENLKNRKIHLTNNSVTKGVNSQSDGIDENMMNEKTFSAQIEKLCGKEVFNSVIKPQMKKIVVESLQSVVENVQYRRNSFQVLGYDFMIDEDLKVWLIEVNSSPTMEYSTKVTTELVERGMNGLADVIENYIMKGKQYRGDKASELYGGWKLLPIH